MHNIGKQRLLVPLDTPGQKTAQISLTSQSFGLAALQRIRQSTEALSIFLFNRVENSKTHIKILLKSIHFFRFWIWFEGHRYIP